MSIKPSVEEASSTVFRSRGSSIDIIGNGKRLWLYVLLYQIVALAVRRNLL